MPSPTPSQCAMQSLSVTVWCAARCPGRDLDLTKPGKWRDRTLEDLATSGALKCARCGAAAGMITVTHSLRADAVWRWNR